MKVKIFSSNNINKIEEKINRWLSSEHNIDIHDRLQSTTQGEIVMSIWYSSVTQFIQCMDNIDQWENKQPSTDASTPITEES